MLNGVAEQVAGMDPAVMRKLMPALMDAKKEVAAGLKAWVAGGIDNDKRFTAHDMRRVMLSLDESMDAIARINPQLQKALDEMRRDTAHLATEHLKFEVARMAHVFGGPQGLATGGLQLNTAAVMIGAERELIKRHRNSANRYVGNVRKDIHHQFAVGLARNETFHQMGQRLRRLGGPRGRVALRGTIGDANAWVEDIPEGLFARYEHWAERLVRTETMNAYNVQHADGIDALNEDLDDDEDAFLKRWDSTLDSRLCEICGPLDRVAVKPEDNFPGGYEHPPAHPYCRCVVVAWHPSWGDIEGETGSREFTGEMPNVAPDAYVDAAAEAKAAGVRVSADRERSMADRAMAKAERAKERRQAQAEQERQAKIEQEQVSGFDPLPGWGDVPYKPEPVDPGPFVFSGQSIPGESPNEYRARKKAAHAKHLGISVEEFDKRELAKRVEAERIRYAKELADRELSAHESHVRELMAEKERQEKRMAAFEKKEALAIAAEEKEKAAKEAPEKERQAKRAKAKAEWEKKEALAIADDKKREAAQAVAKEKERQANAGGKALAAHQAQQKQAKQAWLEDKEDQQILAEAAKEAVANIAELKRKAAAALRVGDRSRFEELEKKAQAAIEAGLDGPGKELLNKAEAERLAKIEDRADKRAIERDEREKREAAELKMLEKQGNEDRAKRLKIDVGEVERNRKAEAEARAERVRQEMLSGLSGSARADMQALLDRAAARRNADQVDALEQKRMDLEGKAEQARRRQDKRAKERAREDLFLKNEARDKVPSMAEVRRKERSKHIAEAYEAAQAEKEYKKAEKAWLAKREEWAKKPQHERIALEKAELDAANAAGGKVREEYFKKRMAEADKHVHFSSQGRSEAKQEARKEQAKAIKAAREERGTAASAPPANEGWAGRQMRTGKITESEKLGGGVNVTELVKVDTGDGPVDAVWKPTSGEDNGVRSNVTAGTYWRREAAASNIAHHFQVDDLVPKTVARESIAANGKAQKGSLQQFVPANGDPMNLQLEDIERARVFDFATGNSDRHGGNMMYRRHSDGRGTVPVLIDNGLSFPEGVPDRFIQPTPVRDALEAIGGDQRRPAQRTLEIIEDLDEVAIARDMLRSGIGKKATISAVKRVRAMKEDPQIVGYEVGGDEYQQDHNWRTQAQKAERMKVDKELISIVERAEFEAALLGDFPLE